METKKYILGFMIFVVLSTSIYFLLPDKIRIDIQNTKTSFKVFENNSWILSGTEYTKLFDGSSNMLASSRNVTYTIEGNKVHATRTAYFKEGIVVYDYYEFDGNLSSVEMYPISHKIRVVNGTGRILQYEVNDLLYFNTTKNNVVSPMSFGHNMKVEWENKNYYSQIFKYKDKNVGKLTIKYKIDSNDYFVNMRLFDPEEILWKGNISFNDIKTRYVYSYIENKTCIFYKNNSSYSSCVQINSTKTYYHYIEKGSLIEDKVNET